MTGEEQDYLIRRAEAELKMAQNATGAEAVKAHYTLAGHYLDRAMRRAARPSRARQPSFSKLKTYRLGTVRRDAR